MIAMQYSFTLPADYDMGIVDRRIRDRGPMTDAFPSLGFKAYLSARRGDLFSAENLYAPFYLWQKPEGASDFLCGPGFEGLTGSFGWPRVQTWIIWQAEMTSDVGSARFATRQILQTEPYAPLADIRRHESEDAVADVERRGALASVSGFEPTTWTRVRFSLWQKPPQFSDHIQIYRVGHMSLQA